MIINHIVSTLDKLKGTLSAFGVYDPPAAACELLDPSIEAHLKDYELHLLGSIDAQLVEMLNREQAKRDSLTRQIDHEMEEIKDLFTLLYGYEAESHEALYLKSLAHEPALPKGLLRYQCAILKKKSQLKHEYEALVANIRQCFIELEELVGHLSTHFEYQLSEADRYLLRNKDDTPLDITLYRDLINFKCKLHLELSLKKRELSEFILKLKAVWKTIGYVGDGQDEAYQFVSKSDPMFDISFKDSGVSYALLRQQYQKYASLLSDRKNERRRLLANIEALKADLLDTGERLNVADSQSSGGDTELTRLIASMDEETLCEKYDLVAMQKLRDAKATLAEKRKIKYSAMTEKHLAKLDELWDRLKVSEAERGRFMESCSSHDIKQIMALYEDQVSVLRLRLEQSMQIIDLVDARTSLISKMKVFEKSASDPARLFASSFRLLEEERFRKNALPDLLRLEHKLLALCRTYEEKHEGQKFMIPYYWHHQCYATQEDELSGAAFKGVPDVTAPVVVEDVLREEMGQRFINRSVFGFQKENAVPSVSFLNANKGTKEGGEQQPLTPKSAHPKKPANSHGLLTTPKRRI